MMYNMCVNIGGFNDFALNHHIKCTANLSTFTVFTRNSVSQETIYIISNTLKYLLSYIQG